MVDRRRARRLPYDLLLGLGFHATPDAEALRGAIWDRPGLADSILHQDLLAAGEARAAGVVIAFDLPREQIAGYSPSTERVSVECSGLSR